MAAGPVSRIPLAPASVADELNYVALADISRLVHDQTTDYRIIGGLMATSLAVCWDLGASLCRETSMLTLAYRRSPCATSTSPADSRQPGTSRSAATGSKDRSLRFRYESPGDSPAYHAAIDVLVPAYTSRPRLNVRVGTELVTTEVPGLHIALARAPVELALDLRRLNGPDWHLQQSCTDTVDPADGYEVRLHYVDDPVTTDTQTVILPGVEACPDSGSSANASTAAPKARIPSWSAI